MIDICRHLWIHCAWIGQKMVLEIQLGPTLPAMAPLCYWAKNPHSETHLARTSKNDE